MNLISYIELNQYLTEKFTHKQLINIIDVCYRNDSKFNTYVEHFYNEMMNMDEDDSYDLIYDICHGDETSFERFAEDINYFCNE